MIEPVTTAGVFVAGALAAGAGALAKAALGEAAKDAYKSLKALLSGWAGSDVAQLEQDPASKGREAVVAELVDRQPEQDRAKATELAAALVDALRRQGPVGVDIGRLEAFEVDLGRIRVSEGTAFRAAEVRTGTFRTDGIELGPGKKS